MDEISALVALHLAFPHTPKKSHALIKSWGSAQAIADQKFDSSTPLFSILQKKSWEKEFEAAQKAKVSLIGFNDPLYPESLRRLPDAPLLLYCKGKLSPEDKIAVAVVGSRTPTSYGLRMAEAFGNDLVAMGCTVVSGLARGIDTKAHKGAVLNIGRTVGVLGSGLNHIYPAENQGLAEEISSCGAILSEYPMNTPPSPFQFPRRNRLITALSLGCVLIEGKEKSGGMIAIEWAHQLGIPCFTIPGPTSEKKFSGNHSLIRSRKARLVENAQEMVSLLVPNHSATKQFTNFAPIGLSAKECALYACFPEREISFDELILRSQTSAAVLEALLLALLMKNVIRQLPGRIYTKG